MFKYILVLCCLANVLPSLSAQDLSSKEILRKVETQFRGESSKSVMKMTIIRPKWQRTIVTKTWSRGNDYYLILITSPARDKGMSFLKREKDLWSWRPNIGRTIKMSSSMMSQSWMGSDLTNDDLVGQSSIVDDYDHKILASEKIEDRDCYKIELVPKAESYIVWGKVIMWVSKEHFIRMKTQFYDEDDYLVNTNLGKNITKFGDRYLPSIIEIIPEEKKGDRTIMEYESLEFGVDNPESFFSIQNMKKVR